MLLALAANSSYSFVSSSSDPLTWEDVNMLVSVHVLGQVTIQLHEKPDLGPQLQLHLGGNKTHLETAVMETRDFKGQRSF